ncbi:MAG: hypothetical protein ABI776_01665 [Nocardioidaceae bacterium]
MSIRRSARTVTGSVLIGGICSPRGNGGGSNKFSSCRLYFTAYFDRAGTWVNERLRPGTTSASGGEGHETGDLRRARAPAATSASTP